MGKISWYFMESDDFCNSIQIIYLHLFWHFCQHFWYNLENERIGDNLLDHDLWKMLFLKDYLADGKKFSAIETMNQCNYLECLFHLRLWLSFGTSFQPLKEISVDNSEFHFYWSTLYLEGLCIPELNQVSKNIIWYAIIEIYLSW